MNHVRGVVKLAGIILETILDAMLMALVFVFILSVGLISLLMGILNRGSNK